MHICLIGYKDNPVSIFNELGKALSKKISGVELEQRFAPFLEDIPKIAMEACSESDFVFVFAVVEDDEFAEVLKEKLIDVELATKTRILKSIESDEFAGLDEEDYLEKKEKLIEDYSTLIVNILFNENSFEPKDKDFSL